MIGMTIVVARSCYYQVLRRLLVLPAFVRRTFATHHLAGLHLFSTHSLTSIILSHFLLNLREASLATTIGPLSQHTYEQSQTMSDIRFGRLPGSFGGSVAFMEGERERFDEELDFDGLDIDMRQIGGDMEEGNSGTYEISARS